MKFIITIIKRLNNPKIIKKVKALNMFRIIINMFNSLFILLSKLNIIQKFLLAYISL